MKVSFCPELSQEIESCSCFKLFQDTLMSRQQKTLKERNRGVGQEIVTACTFSHRELDMSANFRDVSDLHFVSRRGQKDT